MDIVTLGNEVLRARAEPVKDIGKVRGISAKMLDTLQSVKGLGLAAPQVGISERFFIVTLPDDPPRVFINPEILEISSEKGSYEEGCLSLPGIYADVVRPLALRVQAWDRSEKPFTIDAEDLLARVILHEMDHLDGIMFIDHLSELKRKGIMRVWEEKIQV